VAQTADSALEDLFLDHRGKLFAVVFRLVGCRQSAEDLVQEAYVRLRRAQASGGITHPQPFMYQTARNLALDHLRRQRFRGGVVRSGEGLDGAVDIPSNDPAPDVQAGDRQMVDRLEAALNELSPRRREAFLLHRIHGLRYREIATRLRISESAVEKHIRAALLHCLDRLDRESGR